MNLLLTDQGLIPDFSLLLQAFGSSENNTHTHTHQIHAFSSLPDLTPIVVDSVVKGSYLLENLGVRRSRTVGACRCVIGRLVEINDLYLFTMYLTRYLTEDWVYMSSTWEDPEKLTWFPSMGCL